MRPARSNIEFSCPKCGSSKFGSSDLTGRCHGRSGCGFTWAEADSWKYFTLVTKQAFEDDKEYRAFQAQPGPTKGYVIECSTGCSCCSNENHIRGPFSSLEVAYKKVEGYQESRLLASQYAERGRYHVREMDAEVLPDGRVVIANYIASSWADESCEERMELNFY